MSMSHTDPELVRYFTHWTCYKSPVWYYYLCFALAIIVTLCNAFISFMTTKNLFFRGSLNLDKFIKKKSSRFMYTLISILYTLGPCTFVIALTVQVGCFVPQNKLGAHILFIMIVTGVQMMTIGTEILYLFFVLRLNVLFEAIPQLKIKKSIVFTLIFAFPAALFCQCMSFYHYLVDWQDYSWVNALKWGYVALSINVAFDVILVFIFILHEYKLLKYVRSGERTNAIVNFSVRYLWITIIAFTSTNMVNVVNIYLVKQKTMSLMFTKNILILIDTFTNMLCSYLQFKFADRLYYGLCGPCHLTWMKCFGNLGGENERSIAKHINETEMGKPIPYEKTKTTSSVPSDSNDVPKLQRDVSKKDNVQSRDQTFSDSLLVGLK